MKFSYIYMMANPNISTIYTGITSNLKKRVWEHKNKINSKSFTTRYNCIKLVYYEVSEDMVSTIEREKQIKGGSRKDKIELIKSKNPTFKDLSDEIQD